MKIIKNIIKYIVSKGWKFAYFGYGSMIINPCLIRNSKCIYIARNVTIRDFARLEVVRLYEKPIIKIGENVNIEQGLHLTCGNKVIIGNNCSITPYVTITDIVHDYRDINVSPKYQQMLTDEVIIEDDCFLGSGVVILPGVHLGKHCIVGANSVVTKSFPSYSVLAGNPAVIIKKYDFKNNEWKKNTNNNN